MLKKLSTMRIVRVLLVILVVAGFLLLGQWAQAIKLQVAIPGIGKEVAGFPQYLEAIYKLFIGVAGILAVIMIMLGGFQWLMAAGNAQKISGAKTTIISAIMGLVLALGSYTILNLVNPNVVNKLSLTPKPPNLVSKSNVGLCKRNQLSDRSILGAPLCEELYDLPSSTSGNWELDQCAGFLIAAAADSDDGLCLIENDGENTKKIYSVYLEDQRKDGFKTVEWKATDLVGTFNITADCGILYTVTQDRLDNDVVKYYVGTACENTENESTLSLGSCVADLPVGADLSGYPNEEDNIVKDYPLEVVDQEGKLNKAECMYWEIDKIIF